METLDRRTFLALGVGALVVAAAPIAVARRGVLVRRTMPVMGTLAEFVVVAPDTAAAQTAIDAALEALQGVEVSMSRFAATSDVGRANRGAARSAVPVGEPTAAVLREAVAWAECSAGAFDPCLGRAIRLWDVGHRRTPPAASEVRPLAGRRLYRALDVDAKRPVVRFAHADVEIDLGGIAKGWAVDRAAEALRARGIERAIVNVGGDLYAVGDAGDGQPWRVGIQSPHDPRAVVGEVDVRDAAVATSGDYLQFFTHGGRRYHHILDPATGEPRLTAVRSVTIMADTCLAADAAATTAFSTPPARIEAILRARPGHARLVRTITA